ncbi:hypothetical protein, partial [Lacticaseibacillus camelliae]|uniref:hypothetical protein n=1 Tax=Lacticaseibacillus camelliae TaxID=381742 RepID=UPI001F32ADA7
FECLHNQIGFAQLDQMIKAETLSGFSPKHKHFCNVIRCGIAVQGCLFIWLLLDGTCPGH